MEQYLKLTRNRSISKETRNLKQKWGNLLFWKKQVGGGNKAKFFLNYSPSLWDRNWLWNLHDLNNCYMKNFVKKRCGYISNGAQETQFMKTSKVYRVGENSDQIAFFVES